MQAACTSAIVKAPAAPQVATGSSRSPLPPPPRFAARQPAAAARPRQRRLSLACSAQHDLADSPSTRAALDADINAACNAALQAMLANDRRRVPELEAALQALRLRALQEAQDLQTDRLLRVIEGMLHHTVLKEADELEGPHAAALNRMVNQVAGSDWKLGLEGQPVDAGNQEPKFSTWEDVLNKKRAGAGGSGNGSTSDGDSNAQAGGGVADASFYTLLGVAPTASQPEIKAAYRQLALKLHPDVNEAEDAGERFAAVAAAYDVLSDPESRRLYDQFGPEGMRGQPGAAAGRGNSGRAWEEFRPFKKQNKRTKARDASTASYGSSVDEAEAEAGAGQGPGSSSCSGAAAAEQHAGSSNGSSGGDSWAARWAGLPAAGTVVEYPLSERVQEELQDGRTHGVGLLVGRNCDRGDARKLPEEALDLCEVEPLRQEESGSTRWISDELSPSAFVRLGELTPVPVASFDQRFDVWVIEAQLSEGCGGPELGEEIIL